jgi:hypothetical protein
VTSSISRLRLPAWAYWEELESGQLDLNRVGARPLALQFPHQFRRSGSHLARVGPPSRSNLGRPHRSALLNAVVQRTGPPRIASILPETAAADWVRYSVGSGKPLAREFYSRAARAPGLPAGPVRGPGFARKPAGRLPMILGSVIVSAVGLAIGGTYLCEIRVSRVIPEEKARRTIRVFAAHTGLAGAGPVSGCR